MKMKRFLGILLALCFSVSIPFGIQAAGAEIALTISCQIDAAGFIVAPKAVAVAPDLCERYGYTDAFSGMEVSALDAIVAAHIQAFGSGKQAVNDALAVGSSGFISNFMATGSGNLLYFINGVMAETAAGDTKLTSGDKVQVFLLHDPDYMDAYTWFELGGQRAERLVVAAGETISLTLNAVYASMWGDYGAWEEPYDGAAIVTVAPENGGGRFGGVMGITDENGKADITFAQPGRYLLSAVSRDNSYEIPLLSPSLEVTVYDPAAALKGVLGYLQTKIAAPAFNDEWAVLGMIRGGAAVPADYYAAYYAKVKEYVKAHSNLAGGGSQYTEYSRLALALSALGADVTDIAGNNLLLPLANIADVTAQGANGAIFALLAFDAKPWDIPAIENAAQQVTREKLIAAILGAQNTGGGFGLTAALPNVDVTAMALQALAPYNTNENPAVQAAIAGGLAYLAEKQNAGGGYFYTNGGVTRESAESAAQVVIALTALGIDPAADSRFAKNGGNPLAALLALQDTASGGFQSYAGSGVNAFACEQAARALAAYARFQSGANRLYDMGDADAFVEKSDPPAPKDLTWLQQWEAKLPRWLGGIPALPDWFEYVIYFVFFGWIWNFIGGK